MQINIDGYDSIEDGANQGDKGENTIGDILKKEDIGQGGPERWKRSFGQLLARIRQLGGKGDILIVSKDNQIV